MGIEQRRNGSYYYRKRREGDHVVSEYVGGGDFAYLAATLDDIRREEAAEERVQQLRQQREWEQLDTEIRAIGGQVSTIMGALLFSGGYHLHKGQWRKCRKGGTQMSRATNAKGKASSTALTKTVSMETLEQAPGETEVQHVSRIGMLLSECANEKAPRPEMLAFARAALNKYPHMWRLIGDLSIQARYKIINTYSAGPIVEDAMQKGFDQTRKDLGYEGASPMEQMLIDQVALCWLQMYAVQWLYEATMQNSITLRLGEYWEKRLTATQKRYLRAIETLAKVRKMGPNVLMLNVAQQQVNAIIEK